jgi:hypothetical protein
MTNNLFVLVRVVNTNNFMSFCYGIFVIKARIFFQKIVWFGLAMANKINNEPRKKT